ncbi:MAG: N-acyl-D-amino-acid deacylase family protein [Bradymonadaceae bacterium]
MYDIIIRGGRILDGSGDSEFIGDVAIQNGVIAEVAASIEAPASRIVDATGLLVTPGFVDIHTHYDAQATWDPFVTPSGWHGCTTVVMGNCGVGFAPCKPENRQWLINVMEGVEDIPGSALTEGIKWDWETFPEYMDALEQLPRTVDIAAQVPHAAVRCYVMGEAGSENQDATPEEIKRMKELTIEGLEAGALGFSTSRTPLHRSSDGVLVAGTFAQIDELAAFGEALKEVGFGVFEAALEHIKVPDEMHWLRDIAASSGQTVIFNLSQTWEYPEMWKQVLEQLEAAAAQDIPLYAQSAGRAIGILMSWLGTAHPFLVYPAYWTHCGGLDGEEKLAKLRDPAVRDEILADSPVDAGEFANFIATSFDKMYLFDEHRDYEPGDEQSVTAYAERAGKSPQEVAYDALIANDGRGFLYFPLFNYADRNLEPLRAMHLHDRVRMGLSDGGAHCGAICDAGMPTFMLTHWARDRTRGERIPLETIIYRQTRQTAETYGLLDRGLLKPGYRADVNIIDYEGLSLGAPEMVYDLPAGGRRLLQKASGYKMTICAGEVVLEDDECTEARPGKVIRGPQADPVS